ncbi:MAG TPA: hypothetical protein VGT78_10835 [Rhizomicrobium sp.]|nr:hypothetical protein [Rhizomicrobium sp.]
MFARLRMILCCGALCLSTHAVASETWDCTFTKVGEPSNWTRHATIEINGDNLDWRLDPIEMRDPRMSVPATSFHYHILENNDVGTIAAFPEATNEKLLGLIVKATVIVLAKADMSVRMGVVGTYPAQDALTGQCHPK